MDIEKLHKMAIYHFNHIRSNCEFLKIYAFTVEEGNFAFYGLFKCKRRTTIKKVILKPNGDLLTIISL